MPYFKNDDINVLLVHIPKTGGTSLESYFFSKFKIPKNNNALFLHIKTKRLLDAKMNINSTLQHITYNQMVKYSKIFNIDFDNIKIISIVRNPYERLVSDLFYQSLIGGNESKEEVFYIIQKYIASPPGSYDNHTLPQYKYITNNKREIIQNIHILKTENLTNEMKNLGYTDFNVHANVNANATSKKVNYYKYLNDESIEIINQFYHLDFILFNYDKRAPSVEFVI
jgi:hypothetical protein